MPSCHHHPPDYIFLSFHAPVFAPKISIFPNKILVFEYYHDLWNKIQHPAQVSAPHCPSLVHLHSSYDIYRPLLSCSYIIVSFKLICCIDKMNTTTKVPVIVFFPKKSPQSRLLPTCDATSGPIYIRARPFLHRLHSYASPFYIQVDPST